MKHFAIRPAPLAAVLSLCVLFALVYARVAPRLYFGMDDFINGWSESAAPLAVVVPRILAGEIEWSGYRPLTLIMRAVLYRSFGLERMIWYYVLYLALHLANTLLAYRVLRRGGAAVQWAWLGAAIVLLLPSHNEAVLWFAANSNLLAFFFVMLALDFALTSRAGGRRLPQYAAVVAYFLAVLAYEVVITLPLLLFVADWATSRQTLRTRLPLYVGLAVAAAAYLGLAAWATGGSVLPTRSDYAFNPAPAQVGRGYLLLAGQMVLLHTSPWISQPLFQNVREWLPWHAPIALAVLEHALVAGVLVFALGARAEGGAQAAPQSAPPQPRARAHAFWFAWGLLWVLLIGLPFAGLAGRNPENRYTYLLSFGFAVMVVSLLAWGWDALRRRPAARLLVAAPAIALVACYAYVSTSDAEEWARAGDHVRAYQAGLRAQVPVLEADETIVQMGVPGNIGTAYLYVIEIAFQRAVDMLYGQRSTPARVSDLGLRRLLDGNRDLAPKVHVMGYMHWAKSVHRIDTVLFCSGPSDCVNYQVDEGEGPAPTTAWSYVQLYDPQQPEDGGVAMLADMDPWTPVGCYRFYDPDLGEPSDDAYDRRSMEERCEEAARILLAESE